MSASVILERDAAHIKYRYIEHPTVSYQLFMVTQRLSGRPLGLVVLRDHGENGVELMDVVAVRSRLTVLIEVARRLTGELQRPRLFTWLTRPVADVMADSQCSLVQTDVVIPVLIWEQSEENLKVRDRWWLMGGDTDFR